METTIPSYLTSCPSRDLIIAAHQELTREWWEKRRNTFQLYISQLVVDEASVGDPNAARERLKSDLLMPRNSADPNGEDWTTQTNKLKPVRFT